MDPTYSQLNRLTFVDLAVRAHDGVVLPDGAYPRRPDEVGSVHRDLVSSSEAAPYAARHCALTSGARDQVETPHSPAHPQGLRRAVLRRRSSHHAFGMFIPIPMRSLDGT